MKFIKKINIFCKNYFKKQLKFQKKVFLIYVKITNRNEKMVKNYKQKEKKI